SEKENSNGGAKADETKSAKDGKKGDTVAVIVQEVSKWLEGMIKAVEKAAAGGTGTGDSKIGDVASAAGAGAKADETSVKGIALGIKEIVDAAGKAGGEKAGGEKAGDVLKDVKEATDKDNADAGKLFATNANQQADADAIGKASAAVGAVSGKQIIKAIVDAAKAGEHAGANAGAAKNPIAAAIGEANQNGAAFGNDNMKKDDKIAAAIVLRGLAKDGKFAATDEDGAKSAKGVVENAVVKCMSALTGIIRDSVELGLKKVSDAVQAKGKSTPVGSKSNGS
uniref:variable large family protein n=1 Tax=Borreliella bavariensis TaxID=664662 RepID=UPI001BFFE4F3